MEKVDSLKQELNQLLDERSCMEVKGKSEITKKINNVKAKIKYYENKEAYNKRDTEWQKQNKERFDEIRQRASKKYREKKMQEDPEARRLYLAQKQRESRARRKQKELEDLKVNKD